MKLVKTQVINADCPNCGYRTYSDNMDDEECPSCEPVKAYVYNEEGE